MHTQVSVRIRLDQHDDRRLIARIAQARRWAITLTTDDRTKALSAIGQDWVDQAKIEQGIAGLSDAIAKYESWIDGHQKFNEIPHQDPASMKVVNLLSVEHERCRVSLLAVRAELIKLRDHCASYQVTKVEFRKLYV